MRQLLKLVTASLYSAVRMYTVYILMVSFYHLFSVLLPLTCLWISFLSLSLSDLLLFCCCCCCCCMSPSSCSSHFFSSSPLCLCSLVHSEAGEAHACAWRQLPGRDGLLLQPAAGFHQRAHAGWQLAGHVATPQLDPALHPGRVRPRAGEEPPQHAQGPPQGREAQRHQTEGSDTNNNNLSQLTTYYIIHIQYMCLCIYISYSYIYLYYTIVRSGWTIFKWSYKYERFCRWAIIHSWNVVIRNNTRVVLCASDQVTPVTHIHVTHISLLCVCRSIFVGGPTQANNL